MSTMSFEYCSSATETAFFPIISHLRDWKVIDGKSPDEVAFHKFADVSSKPTDSCQKDSNNVDILCDDDDDRHSTTSSVSDSFVS